MPRIEQDWVRFIAKEQLFNVFFFFFKIFVRGIWTIFFKVFIEFVTMLLVLCIVFLAARHVGP